MTKPYVPVDLETVSIPEQTKPEFDWINTGDPDTPSEDLTYKMEIYQRTEFASTLILTVNDIPNVSALSAMVQYELPSALTNGSYLAVLMSWDGHDYSDPADAMFTISYSTIDKTKVIIVAPEFEDPTLGVVRFWDPATVNLYNMLKNTQSIFELTGL